VVELSQEVPATPVDLPHALFDALAAVPPLALFLEREEDTRGVHVVESKMEVPI
jgi:hypothetical protein